jgi:Glycosyl transferases group 1
MKVGQLSSESYKLVVLDANFYWTEQLFSACHKFADVLLLRPRDFRTFYKQYQSYFIDWQPRSISDGIWEQRICCPPGWLFHYWLLTRRFFAHFIRKFQGKSPLIFVFSYPYYYDIAKDLNAYSIYYNIDDYQHYWPGRESQAQRIESLAVNHANLTLCVAQYRAEKLQQLYPDRADKIAYLPHGCTQEFMVEKPLDRPNSLPAELQNFARPIAGYIGALNYRFDFSYLAKVAAQLPEVTFILGGQPPQPQEGSAEWWQGVDRVRRLPNVRFIDRVPHNRLGEYLQSFDVLLMPYSSCNFNQNSCPTKLWDYMGTSLPVVANNVVPEVNQWHHIIRISETPEEFAANMRISLENPTWKARERWEIARSHTWQMQAKKLYHLLETCRGLC